MTFKQCLSQYIHEGTANAQFEQNLKLLDVPKVITEAFIGTTAEYIDGDWFIENESYNKSVRFAALTIL